METIIIFAFFSINIHLALSPPAYVLAVQRRVTGPVLVGIKPPSPSYSPRARVAAKGGYQGPTGTYLFFTK